jgi:hypothetical protein
VRMSWKSHGRASQFIATFMKQPEGLPEISRGLSESASDTPGSIRNDHDPGGVVESAALRRILAPRRGAVRWASKPGVSPARSGFNPRLISGKPPACETSCLQETEMRQTQGSSFGHV